MRTMARSPDDRFADARELARALAPYGSGSHVFEELTGNGRAQLLDRLHEATPMFSSAAANTVVDPVIHVADVNEPAIELPLPPPRTPVSRYVLVGTGLLAAGAVAIGVLITRSQPAALPAPAPSAEPVARVETPTPPVPVPIAPSSAPLPAASRTTPRAATKPAVSKETPPPKSTALPVHL
jgi:hypothetical protein